MTVLSSLYKITLDHLINAHVHGNYVAVGINATDKLYLKKQMKLLDTLASNYSSKIGILTSAPKDVSIIFSKQCLHIQNDNDLLNGIKGSAKINTIDSLFKHQPRFYNSQRNNDTKPI